MFCLMGFFYPKGKKDFAKGHSPQKELYGSPHNEPYLLGYIIWQQNYFGRSIQSRLENKAQCKTVQQALVFRSPANCQQSVISITFPVCAALYLARSLVSTFRLRLTNPWVDILVTCKYLSEIIHSQVHSSVLQYGLKLSSPGLFSKYSSIPLSYLSSFSPGHRSRVHQLWPSGGYNYIQTRCCQRHHYFDN